MDHSCCAQSFSVAFARAGQVLSHHQLSSDTATEDDFFETVLL
jgi:hypothetical protein